MYKIILEKDVEKFLWKHPQLIETFIQALDILAINPFKNTLDIKRLKGQKNSFLRRLRINKYRFIYEVVEDKILIRFIKAWSRGNMYKNSK